jgi:hypothetical protein
VIQLRSCNAGFQCTDGERRADASGCAGKLARSCGPYRDVYCPASAIPLARSCGTSCSAHWECNVAAGYYCDEGECVLSQ